jgi:glutathione S-transferase
VIDDDGVIVADSNAILVYLALRYAKPDWFPTQPVAAAEVQRWLSVAAGPLAYGAARARVIELFRLAEDTAAPIAQGHRLFTLMERTLAARPFLAGALPTIADVSLYAYTAHAPEGGVSLADYPALRAWLARIEALPGFVAMRASAIGLLAA